MAEKKTQRQNPMDEMAGQARKQYEEAVRTGQKLQEEAGQWWTRLLEQTASAADWQKQWARMASVTTGMLPMAQKRMEDFMKWMAKSNAARDELYRKASDAMKATNIAECQAKWMDFYLSSLGMIRSDVEAVTELNTQAIESWVTFVQHRAQTRAGQAQRGA